MRKPDPVQKARRLAGSLDARVGEARSKARAASHAEVKLTRGATSFSAGAGADAGADAGTKTGANQAESDGGGSRAEDTLAQLERAEALHAAGAISDAEYTSLKARLLDTPQ